MDMETELFPCLVEMRFKGVRVDVEAAHKLKTTLLAQEKESLHQVKKETGSRYPNMGSKIHCASF